MGQYQSHKIREEVHKKSPTFGTLFGVVSFIAPEKIDPSLLKHSNLSELPGDLGFCGDLVR